MEEEGYILVTDRTTEAAGQQLNKIKADATKDFFVKMITRDISLRDCIFDLLDNAIDGARRGASTTGSQPFIGRKIELRFDSQSFEIWDDCGGILLSDAINYAFHFGRKPNSPADVKGGIGLYGIGMKRAIFKIGRYCEVFSDADDAAFKVTVNVSEWESREDWDFAYEDRVRTDERGTRIKITDLNDGISQSLSDPAFKNELMRDIARDYAFFIQKELEINVCGDLVPSYTFQLSESNQVLPSFEEYEDDGVRVRIMAGLAEAIPNDVPDDLKPDKVDRFGWFVICNDRVVLPADKTDRTVWGDDDFNVWHPQYNGFAGFVFFYSDDQRKLPWTTTKRELDASSPLYRRTITRMKLVTKIFMDYTDRRKFDIPAAQKAETPIRQVNISELKTQQSLKLPRFESIEVKPDNVNISYRKPKREVEEIRSHIGNVAMTAKDVGSYTFDHFRKVELGK